MNRYAKRILQAGIVNGFLYVAFSAFGAHALKDLLSVKQLSWFNTAADYQIIHALALLALGLFVLLDQPRHVKLLNLVAILFILGIALFSGSLYLLALGGARWLVALTPLGGLLFLLGWLMWFFALLKSK